jgi:hypothetical protein
MVALGVRRYINRIRTTAVLRRVLQQNTTTSVKAITAEVLTKQSHTKFGTSTE